MAEDGAFDCCPLCRRRLQSSAAFAKHCTGDDDDDHDQMVARRVRFREMCIEMSTYDVEPQTTVPETEDQQLLYCQELFEIDKDQLYCGVCVCKVDSILNHCQSLGHDQAYCEVVCRDKLKPCVVSSVSKDDGLLNGDQFHGALRAALSQSLPRTTDGALELISLVKETDKLSQLEEFVSETSVLQQKIHEKDALSAPATPLNGGATPCCNGDDEHVFKKPFPVSKPSAKSDSPPIDEDDLIVLDDDDEDEETGETASEVATPDFVVLDECEKDKEAVDSSAERNDLILVDDVDQQVDSSDLHDSDLILVDEEQEENAKEEADSDDVFREDNHCVLCRSSHATDAEWSEHTAEIAHKQKAAVYRFLETEKEWFTVYPQGCVEVNEHIRKTSAKVLGCECVIACGQQYKPAKDIMFWVCSVCYCCDSDRTRIFTHLQSVSHSLNYVTKFHHHLKPSADLDEEKMKETVKKICAELLSSDDDVQKVKYAVVESDYMAQVEKFLFRVHQGSLNKPISANDITVLSKRPEPFKCTDDYKLMWCEACWSVVVSYTKDDIDTIWDSHCECALHGRNAKFRKNLRLNLDYFVDRSPVAQAELDGVSDEKVVGLNDIIERHTLMDNKVKTVATKIDMICLLCAVTFEAGRVRAHLNNISHLSQYLHFYFREEVPKVLCPGTNKNQQVRAFLSKPGVLGARGRIRVYDAASFEIAINEQRRAATKAAKATQEVVKKPITKEAKPAVDSTRKSEKTKHTSSRSSKTGKAKTSDSDLVKMQLEMLAKQKEREVEAIKKKVVNKVAEKRKLEGKSTAKQSPSRIRPEARSSRSPRVSSSASKGKSASPRRAHDERSTKQHTASSKKASEKVSEEKKKKASDDKTKKQAEEIIKAIVDLSKSKNTKTIEKDDVMCSDELSRVSKAIASSAFPQKPKPPPGSLNALDEAQRKFWLKIVIQANRMTPHPHRPIYMSPEIAACAEPIVGLRHIAEFECMSGDHEPGYVCDMCEELMLAPDLIAHLSSLRHRMKHLSQNYTTYYESVKAVSQPNARDAMLKNFCSKIELDTGRGTIIHRLSVKLDPKILPNKLNPFKFSNAFQASVPPPRPPQVVLPPVYAMPPPGPFGIGVPPPPFGVPPPPVVPVASGRFYGQTAPPAPSWDTKCASFLQKCGKTIAPPPPLHLLVPPGTHEDVVAVQAPPSKRTTSPSNSDDVQIIGESSSLRSSERSRSGRSSDRRSGDRSRHRRSRSRSDDRSHRRRSRERRESPPKANDLQKMILDKLVQHQPPEPAQANPLNLLKDLLGNSAESTAQSYGSGASNNTGSQSSLQGLLSGLAGGSSATTAGAAPEDLLIGILSQRQEEQIRKEQQQAMVMNTLRSMVAAVAPNQSTTSGGGQKALDTVMSALQSNSSQAESANYGKLGSLMSQFDQMRSAISSRQEVIREKEAEHTRNALLDKIKGLLGPEGDSAPSSYQKDESRYSSEQRLLNNASFSQQRRHSPPAQKRTVPSGGLLNRYGEPPSKSGRNDQPLLPFGIDKMSKERGGDEHHDSRQFNYGRGAVSGQIDYGFTADGSTAGHRGGSRRSPTKGKGLYHQRFY